MTKLLLGLFARGGNPNSPVWREKVGRLAGAVGIVSNLLLFAAKLLAGFVSGSIAIMADAVNNLSDCASSVITLLGFRLSRMPADEEHPWGHARFEHISGLVVSFLVLAIGVQFFTSSVEKILHPDVVRFSPLVAVILAVSAAVKFWQGRFNKKLGGLIGSITLEATAADSLGDSLATLAVLAGAGVAAATGLTLDGWLGLAVAVFIIVSGIRLVRETIDPLLGRAPSAELVGKIQSKILSYETVIGLHDLVVHNYGPGRRYASVHVEVPASQDILVSHDLIDRIERDFAAHLNIELVIHLDPIVTDDAKTSELRAFIEAAAKEIDPVLTTHDFRMVEGKTHTNLIFDVVMPPKYRLRDQELRALFAEKTKDLGGCYYCVVTIDRSYTSTR